MVTLTVKVDSSKHANELVRILRELNFVQEVKKDKPRLEESNSKKNRLLKKISEGLQEVKKAQEGKIKLKSLDQLLDEL